MSLAQILMLGIDLTYNIRSRFVSDPAYLHWYLQLVTCKEN